MTTPSDVPGLVERGIRIARAAIEDARRGEPAPEYGPNVTRAISPAVASLANAVEALTDALAALRNKGSGDG